MNEMDIGWLPFVQSWCEDRGLTTLVPLVDKYVASSLEFLAVDMHHVIPLSDINLIQTLCYLLEGLLPALYKAEAEVCALAGSTYNEFYCRIFVESFICIRTLSGQIT